MTCSNAVHKLKLLKHLVPLQTGKTKNKRVATQNTFNTSGHSKDKPVHLLGWTLAPMSCKSGLATLLTTCYISLVINLGPWSNFAVVTSKTSHLEYVKPTEEVCHMLNNEEAFELR